MSDQQQWIPTIETAKRRYKHGTHARYVLARCRCKPCSRANTDYETARTIARAPWRAKKDSRGTWRALDRRSGKFHARYIDRDEARAGVAQLNVEHLKQNPPPNALVDAAPARTHIAWLQEQGVGRKVVAKQAKVAYSVLERILSGDIKRTRRAAAERILAVQPEAASAGSRMRVDETLVLINNLVSAGYRRGWIAQQLGNKFAALHIGRTEWVLIRTARKLHKLYVKLQAQDANLPRIDPAFRPTLVESSFARGRYSRSKITKARPTVTADRTFPHGTRARYTESGCRCSRCSKAEREYQAARRAQDHLPFQIRQDGNDAWVVRNTVTSAIIFRSSDRAAVLKVRDELNSADALFSGKVLVDVAPVREHLLALRAMGVGQTMIARAAGVSNQIVWRIQQNVAKHVRRSTATQLLAIDEHALPANGLTDASPTHLLLDRLQLAGFELEWIAHLLGTTASSLTSRRRFIRVGRARTIHALYASLSERVAILRSLESARRAA